MADIKWNVVKMPETDVRLIIPESVELFCMAGLEKDGRMEFECCKAGNTSGIEISFPLMAIIDGLKRLPREKAKEGACYAIFEIAKFAGIGIMKMEAPEKIMKDIFGGDK